MNGSSRQNGFSLTEVMMAAGILAIGFMLVAGSFPVAIKLTAEKTEGSIGAVTANEAFAKIRIYYVNSVNLYSDRQRPFSRFLLADDYGLTEWQLDRLLLAESCYPSTNSPIEDVDSGAWDDRLGQGYTWSALLRKTDSGNLQATVFVVRLTEGNSQYKYYIPAQNPDNGEIASDTRDFPSPVPVIRVDDGLPPGQMVTEIEVDKTAPANDELLQGGTMECLSRKAELVDDLTGKIMKVEAKSDPAATTLILELAEPVEEAALGDRFWIIPAEDDSKRYPCVGVYQRTLTF